MWLTSLTRRNQLICFVRNQGHGAPQGTRSSAHPPALISFLLRRHTLLNPPTHPTHLHVVAARDDDDTGGGALDEDDEAKATMAKREARRRKYVLQLEGIHNTHNFLWLCMLSGSVG